MLVHLEDVLAAYATVEVGVPQTEGEDRPHAGTSNDDKLRHAVVVVELDVVVEAARELEERESHLPERGEDLGFVGEVLSHVVTPELPP